MSEQPSIENDLDYWKIEQRRKTQGISLAVSDSMFSLFNFNEFRLGNPLAIIAMFHQCEQSVSVCFYDFSTSLWGISLKAQQRTNFPFTFLFEILQNNQALWPVTQQTKGTGDRWKLCQMGEATLPSCFSPHVRHFCIPDSKSHDINQITLKVC